MPKGLVSLYLKKQIFLIIALVFIIAYYCTATTLPAQATVFPRILLWVIIPIALWNMVGSYFELKKELAGNADKEAVPGELDEAKGSDPKGTKKLGGLGFILAYIIAIPYLGFFVSTTLYLCGFAYYLGIRNPGRLFAYIAVIDLFTYYVFVHWLEIRFPQGFLY